MNQRISSAFSVEPTLVHHIAVRAFVIVTAVAFLPSVFIADINHYFDVGQDFGFSQLPYRDFLWEFPPVTTLTLLLIPLSGANHDPFFFLFVALMVLLEVFTFKVARQLADDSDRPAFSWYWLLVFVPLSAVAYFRFDWAAAFFGALGLVGLLRARTSLTVIGILGGFGVKAWTIIYAVPLIGLKRFRTAAISITACAALVGAWYVFSPSGLESFLQYRKGSAFQIESIPGSMVMLFGTHDSYFEYGAIMVSDAGWNWLQPILPAIFVAVAGFLVLVMWKRSLDVVALSAFLVLLLMLTSRLLSPQYLVWMAPFVALLFTRFRRQGWWFAIAAALTIVELVFYSSVINGGFLASLVVVLRNVALLAALWELTLVMWRSKQFRLHAALDASSKSH